MELPFVYGATFDFIVVGAGTAGSAIAARLSEIEDCSVLLIEAGGNPPLFSVAGGTFPLLSYSDFDWKYKAEYNENIAQGHMQKTLNLTAGKMLGGTSSLQHLIFARGFPSDYDKWAEISNDDSWRFGNIFKYLLKSEHLKDEAIVNSKYVKYHGTNGTIGTAREHHEALNRYLEAFKDIGYEVLIDSNNGKLVFSEMLFMITEKERQSSAKAYLVDQIKKQNRSNVSILKNTLVTKVLFDDNKAIGVAALTEDDKEVTYKAKKEVILSAGAFNSPKILLLSGVGPKEDLEKLNIPVVADLPVGEKYQDQPSLYLVEKVQRLPLIPTTPGPFEFPTPGLSGFVTFNNSQKHPDYQHLDLLVQNKPGFSILCSVVFSYSDEVCDSILKETFGYEFLLLVPSLLHPISYGKVSLKNKDPREPPLIQTGMLSEEADQDMMVAIVEDALKVENSTFFRDAGAELIEIDLPECKKYIFRSRDYWKCYIKYMTGATYHYTGTCSMGSVVHGNLKVKGLENLRVADASVIPYLPSGKLHAPVLIVAEKAADIIKATHNLKEVEDKPSHSSEDFFTFLLRQLQQYQ